MYRYKDFSMMSVIDVSGKKIGFIKDIVIDFNLGSVKGFQVSPYNLFVKSIFVYKEHIISFSDSMIISDSCREPGLLFMGFKNMEIVDISGNMVGMFEDIIFDEDLIIKGIVISFGIVRKLLEGKKIALIKDIIVGERKILLLEKGYKFNLMSNPHNFLGVNCYEEKS